MTCHGIAVFHLQGVDIRIATQNSHPGPDGGRWSEQVGIVESRHVKRLISFRLKRGGVAHKGVEQNLAVEGEIAVGEPQIDV